MSVPTPHWFHRQVVKIPGGTIEKAAVILAKHLSSYGPDGANGGGLKLVGGEKWWRVRGRKLEGEWIEVSHQVQSTFLATITISFGPLLPWVKLKLRRCRKTISDGKPPEPMPRTMQRSRQIALSHPMQLPKQHRTEIITYQNEQELRAVSRTTPELRSAEIESSCTFMVR